MQVSPVPDSTSLPRVLAADLRKYAGERVLLKGWMHQLRKLGEVNFLILRDRSGLAQAVLSPQDMQPLDGLQDETVIALEGKVTLAKQAPGGAELQEVTVHVVTPVYEPPPFELNKKTVKASVPVFLDHATVGLRSMDRRAIPRLGAGVMAGFRNTLNALDFTEVQTPKLVASATESGANVFPVEYFEKTAYLAQSPQFYKQIMVGIFERVYEVGPVFRAEPHTTTRHINEYVSLDVEFGFIEDHFTVIGLLTEVIRGIINYLDQGYQPELKLLEVKLPQIADHIPWIHFAAAQVMLADQFGLQDAIGAPDLTPEHERTLGKWAQEQYNSDFLFVTGYPMSKRPFYTHPDPKTPAHSNSFDLLFRGTELVTGGQRLHRYEDYIAAATRQGYDLSKFDTYFEAFKHGMPPHGGFAIGMERFLMQLIGLENIKLATLFPRDMQRLTP